MSLASSLLYALRHLLHPRMLWLMVWPMLISIALWTAVAISLWGQLAAWLAELLRRWLEPAAAAMHIGLGDAWLVLSNVLLIVLFVPHVYFTALLILGLFGMQRMVEFVASRSFPSLERRQGGSFAGSVWNAVIAAGGMVGLFVVSVPLWLLPPLWPLIPLAIFAWVNQRLLRYDALGEHASHAEMAQLFADERFSLYLLGLLLALLAYVPLLGFVAPVLLGLAYIHYLLSALQALRARKDQRITG